MIDHKLANWDDVKDEIAKRKTGKTGILIGNGASRAVWDKFKYKSLFDLACLPNRQNCLMDEDIDIFKEMDNTENFELVLSSLTTTRRINEILTIRTTEVVERYNSIRLALIQAVRDIHIPYKSVSPAVKTAINLELGQYQTIYSTNYDLLLYWCIMDGGAASAKDYFWGAENCFDLEDCGLRGESRTILYLHGALHLYRTPSGVALKKIVTEIDGGLLDQFDTSGKLVPLIISEGKSRDKKSAILRNDYLAFAIRKFKKHEGNLVVFGQSLGEDYDHHLIESIKGLKRVDAMRGVKDRIIAISMHPSADPASIRFEKARLEKAIPNMELRFFDSTTHPLGSEKLRVVE